MKQAMRVLRVSTLAILTVTAFACGNKKEAAGNAGQGASADTEEAAGAPLEIVADAEGAKAIFVERCVACHGTGGQGDGPGAAAITPKPRDYTDSAWQASVGDEDIAAAILKGGLGVGKSGVMPANPDLEDKPAMVKGLVDIVRGFEK